jgi:hypothetical protein
MSENLHFTVTEVGSIVFDQAIYHVGDTVTAQWSVINLGDAGSQDGELCSVGVTDPHGDNVTPDPADVSLPALAPAQQTDTLTTQFPATMPTSPVALYTVVLALPNGQTTQNTCTVNDA